jgi:hypothetical protein
VQISVSPYTSVETKAEVVVAPSEAEAPVGSTRPRVRRTALTRRIHKGLHEPGAPALPPFLPLFERVGEFHRMPLISRNPVDVWW